MHNPIKIQHKIILNFELLSLVDNNIKLPKHLVYQIVISGHMTCYQNYIVDKKSCKQKQIRCFCLCKTSILGHKVGGYIYTLVC